MLVVLYSCWKCLFVNLWLFICESLVLLMGRSRSNFSPKLESLLRTSVTLWKVMFSFEQTKRTRQTNSSTRFVYKPERSE